MLEDIWKKIHAGQLNEALSAIDNLSGTAQLEGIILKSRIFNRMGDHETAFNHASQALTLSIKQGRKTEELGARVALAIILLRLHKFDEIDKQVIEVNRLLKEIKNNYQVKKYYEASLKNVLGLRLRYQGELDKALNYYQESLEICSKLGIKESIAIVLTNIGTIYQIQGEIDDALNHHIEALAIFVELGNEQLIGITLQDIAEIYWEFGNLELAKQYFEKALNIRLSHNNHLHTAQTLFSLILLNFANDYPDQSKYYFNMLEEIYREHVDQPDIVAYYNLSQASFLKRSSRLINRAEAQKLFQKVIKNPPLDHKLTKYALLSLCELLLLDLKVTKDADVIKRVQILTDKLLQMAKDQHSNLLLVETYLLQSKLALINLDLEKALYLLTQAELIAKEKELYNAAMKLSGEYDNIMDKLNKWERLQKRKASLIERVEEVEIQKTIDSLLSRYTNEVLEIEEETPLFILILNNKAITIYSNKFEKTTKINEKLIGGFLMATDFGIGKVFDNSGFIERIKYGDHTLIFSKHEQLTFCYGFEGQSFYAIQRLQNFIEGIKLGRSWQLLNSDIIKPKKIKKTLDQKVNDFFLAKSMLGKEKFFKPEL